MANPANLTVTAKAANAGIVQPAGSTIDTDGTVPILAADLDGACDRLLLHVTNGDGANGLTVTIEHGDNPPAVRESLGNLAVSLAASAVSVIGPFDGSRFLQNDGTFRVAFATVGGANATATVRSYLLPKAV